MNKTSVQLKKELEEKLKKLQVKVSTAAAFALKCHQFSQHFPDIEAEEIGRIREKAHETMKEIRHEQLDIERELERVEELIREDELEKLNKKKSKLNPNFTYTEGKVHANGYGTTPTPCEVLLFKDEGGKQKMLVFESGSSEYTGRMSGVQYSNSSLKLIEVIDATSKEFIGKTSIVFGNQSLWSRSPIREKTLGGGRLSKKMLADSIEQIREFFGVSTLEAKDIVRGFVLFLTPIQNWLPRKIKDKDSQGIEDKDSQGIEDKDSKSPGIIL